jgi:hypothetical protein
MTVDELTIRMVSTPAPLTTAVVVEGLGPDAVQRITGVADDSDPEAITMVDGEIDGTEDDLTDVVEEIVIEQVAQFMAGRR